MDIRKFFAPKTGGGSTAAKPSGEAHKPAGDEAASPAVPAAAAAPAAPGDEQGAGSSKATNRTPSRGKGSKKSPAKPEPASKSAAAPAAAKPKAPSKSPEGRGAPAAKPKATSKSAGAKSAAASIPAKRKKSEATSKTGGGQGNDSDWSDEVDLAQQSSDADDFEIDLASESEEEESRQAAKAKKKGPRKEQEPAAKRAKPTPSSTRKKPAAAAKLPAALQRIADNAEAMAAVAAVDAAVKALPPFDDDAIVFMPEAQYGGGRAPDDPPNRGKKAVPSGHPDCLTGKTFVISGILDSLKREEAEDLIKRHGGKVTGNVSSKTSFLLIGSFAGRSKFFHAKENQVPRMSEDGLFALIRAAPGGVDEAEAVEVDAVEETEAKRKQQPAQQQQQQQQQQAAGPSGTAPGSFYGGASKASAPAPKPGPAAAAPPRPGPAANQQLWVEKWRPKTSQELVGNITTVNTLRQWLREWEQVHLHGGKPSAPPGNSSKRQAADMAKNAVLLSGPPGIGKTSSALIICRELGFEPVEVNASDSRGKADSSVLKGVGGKLANAVKELSTNRAVSYDKQGNRKKLCLIMDEVDGMSAGDRGGVADLIQTIHKTRVPIIAICNDKYSTKLRSLRNHCLELDYRKPTVQQIGKRMLDICAKEGLSMNQATMDALVQSANGGDIRLILGQLQMIRLRACALSYDQVKSGGMATAKDPEMSPFEASRRLLSFDADGLSLADQIDLVFQDLDLVPLLVQENYVNHRPNIARDDAMRLRILSKAADAVSAGDVATRAVRQYQNWSLAPFAAAVGTVYPATYMRGSREVFSPHEPNFPRFSAWLGQNSSFGKKKRLLGELHTRMLSSGALECDKTSLRLSYLPVLRGTLARPLVSEGKDGIEAVLRMMRAYCISREDFDFVADVTKFKTAAAWGEDPMKGVETQVKSAFTRAFNQQHIKPRTGFGMDDKVSRKKGKGRKAQAPEEDEDPFGEEGVGQEGAADGSPAKSQEEDDDDETDPVLLEKKLKGLKHKGLTLTMKDGSEAKGGGRGRGRGGRSGGAGRGRGAASGRGRGKK